jgi:hypothetical protein
MEIEVINNNKEYITTNDDDDDDDDDTNFTNNTETNTNTNTTTDTNTNTNTRWAKTNFVDLQSSPCIFFLRQSSLTFFSNQHYANKEAFTVSFLNNSDPRIMETTWGSGTLLWQAEVAAHVTVEDAATFAAKVMGLEKAGKGVGSATNSWPNSSLINLLAFCKELGVGQKAEMTQRYTKAAVLLSSMAASEVPLPLPPIHLVGTPLCFPAWMIQR